MLLMSVNLKFIFIGGNVCFRVNNEKCFASRVNLSIPATIVVSMLCFSLT